MEKLVRRRQALAKVLNILPSQAVWVSGDYFTSKVNAVARYRVLTEKELKKELMEIIKNDVGRYTDFFDCPRWLRNVMEKRKVGQVMATCDGQQYHKNVGGVNYYVLRTK